MTASGLEPTTTYFINKRSNTQPLRAVCLNVQEFVYELSGS